MKSFVLLTILLVSTGHVLAQESASSRSLERTPADPELFVCREIHYAGVYHLASGVFEPASRSSPNYDGPQPATGVQGVIYDNSCKVAGGVLQSALNGSTYIDDGRIPSTTSPSPNTGTLDHYRVNKLQISYAVRDVTGSPFSIRLRVWDHLFQDATNCTSLAAAGNPIINYQLNGLPGSPVQGQLTGYVLDIDLIGTEFCISGDANGVFDGDAYANGFGYGLTLLGQSGNTPATAGGFFVTGLASGAGACGMGEGTYFNNPSAAAGTGLDDDVTWYRDGQSGQSSGCFTFSGSATGAAGFWLVMWADVTNCTACAGNPPTCGGTSPGVVICEPGTAGVIACPCANPPTNAGLGCNNSSSTGGAHLAATGVASLSADTLVFTTSGEKPTATSLVLQGDGVSASGNVFGQGVNCVTGQFSRLYLKTAAGGSITAPQGADPAVHVRSAAQGDTIAAGTRRYYAVHYRDATVLGGCPAASTFNITQGLRVLWTN
jgi:hypothetical protein